jgi:hypothetical protein
VQTKEKKKSPRRENIVRNRKDKKTDLRELVTAKRWGLAKMGLIKTIEHERGAATSSKSVHMGYERDVEGVRRFTHQPKTDDSSSSFLTSNPNSIPNVISSNFDPPPPTSSRCTSSSSRFGDTGLEGEENGMGPPPSSCRYDDDDDDAWSFFGLGATGTSARWGSSLRERKAGLKAEEGLKEEEVRSIDVRERLRVREMGRGVRCMSWSHEEMGGAW